MKKKNEKRKTTSKINGIEYYRETPFVFWTNAKKKKKQKKNFVFSLFLHVFPNQKIQLQKDRKTKNHQERKI